MTSNKDVDIDNQRNIVKTKFSYNIGNSRFDSRINQSSNLCLQISRITHLHRNLKKRKIQLEIMLLKKFKQLNNLEYILIPLSIEQDQKSVLLQQSFSDSAILSKKKILIESNVYFMKGKVFEIREFGSQNPDKQQSILQTTQLSTLYKFVKDICSAIVQLQGMCIYHADINLRNIIYCQGQYKFIDFGEALCFNEEQQYQQLKKISQECVDIINDLKQRRQQVYLDYLNKQKKDKFEQYSFRQYKSLYKEMHSQQFVQLFDTYTRVKNRSQSTQDERIKQIIKKYIKNRQYNELTQLCCQKIEELGQARQKMISQRNNQSSNLLNQNHKHKQLKNYDSSQDQKSIDVQLQKSEVNSQYTSQQSPIQSPISLSGRQISSDELVLNSITKYKQENNSNQKEQIQSQVPSLGKMTSYIRQQSPQKDNFYLKQHSEQQLCDHQTISKICLSIKCIEKNQYLLCACQRDHINKQSDRFRSCNIINFKDISKFTDNLEQKIKYWGSQNQYLRLIESFHNNHLSKMEHYYKQMTQNIISQLQSLSKYNEINDHYFNPENIDGKKQALQLSGLYSFSKFKSKMQFDQFIQFTSDSLDISLGKIVQFAIKQLRHLTDKIAEALNQNQSTNIVNKYLKRKYRKVVVSSLDESLSGHVQSNGQKKKIYRVPLHYIKSQHFPKIKYLTLRSDTQQILGEEGNYILQNKLEQQYKKLKEYNYLQAQNKKDIVQNIRKSLQTEYKKQSYLCKILKFISSNDFLKLKQLEIDLNDSGYNKGCQFSMFDLFSLLSKTQIYNLTVRGVKIVYFQQFIQVLYALKHDQSSVNDNAILDNKHDYFYNQKFHKSELLTIQIDIQIRFNFKFKESMQRKKQQLFYFLAHIKQLKYITLTLQFKYSQNYQQSFHLIQELMQHPKIRDFRLNILSLQVLDFEETNNFFVLFNRISQFSQKIIALQFQNVQFGQLEKTNTEANTKYFGDIISKILSYNIKYYSVLNCRCFPMIDLSKTNLIKLMIFNTTFQTKSIEQESPIICNTIQSLCIRSSRQFFQTSVNCINFKKLIYLNISFCGDNLEYLVNQQLPLLKILIVSGQKYINISHKLTNLWKLISTKQSLQVFNGENIMVGSDDIKSIKPSTLRVLKLSKTIVQNQWAIINLFQNLNQITELSLIDITPTKQSLKLHQFYCTFERMQNLRQLRIDNSLINSQFDINKLRKKGIYVAINKSMNNKHSFI